MAVCDSFLFRAVHYYLGSVSCDVKLMPNPSDTVRENNTFLFLFLLPCCNRKYESKNLFWNILFPKGQLISKCLFGVFTFFQKTNENKSTSSKVKFVCSFFGRNVGLKKSFRICLTFSFLVSFLLCHHWRSSLYTYIALRQCLLYVLHSDIVLRKRRLVNLRAVHTCISFEAKGDCDRVKWRG